MLICYELQSIGFNIFLILAAITMNDINMLVITVLLFAIGAAETAIGLSLLIVSSKRLGSNKLSNMNNIRS